MVRKSVVAGALGAAFALLCAGPVLALSVTVADNGGNTVSIDYVTPDNGDWDVGITEDYLTVNSIWIEFQQELGQHYSGEDVRIEKTIHNGSDVLWRDFHMKLWVPDAAGDWVPSPNNDGLYFTSVGATGPFGQVWFDPNLQDELWLWDGVWNHCETYTLTFAVGGWGWGDSSVPHFRLEQWPTETGGPDVPEPATLLLTLAGVAGLALRRRRSA